MSPTGGNPPAPAPSTGLLPAGTYYEKYTYVNATGESAPSLESNEFTVQPKDLPQVFLPFVPPGVQSINVYLTPANGASGSEVFYANYTSLSAQTLSIAPLAFGVKPPMTSTITLPDGAPPLGTMIGGLAGLNVVRLVPTGLSQNPG